MGRHIAAVLLAVCCTAAAAYGQEADDYAKARALAAGGQRGEAIAMLRRMLAASPGSGDVLLLLGTVLSWEGQYDESRSLLEQTLAAHPNDTDAISALMNVELWSGHPRQSRELARRGLARAPNDDRFLKGRERAQHAIDQQRPWEVSAAYSYDWFNDGRSSWHETQASLKRATPAGPVIVRGSHAERFSLSDNMVEVEMYPRFRSGTYAYVSAGFGSDDALYPDYRALVDLYQSIGKGFEIAGGYRRVDFSVGTDIYTAALNKYIGNWLLMGRGYYIPGVRSENSQSYHAEFRRYFGGSGTDYVGGRYSHGAVRQEVRDIQDLAQLGSDGVFGEILASVRPRLQVQAYAGTSRQEQLNGATLRQHSLSASVRVKF